MARLPQGVKKRADGRFEKRFTVDGKRYSVYGKTTKEVQAKEQEVRKQISDGTYTADRNITLDRYYEDWLKQKRSCTKPNTLKTYTSYYNKHIKPVFGGKKVQNIERSAIISWQTERAENESINIANYALKVLSIVLEDAVRAEIIMRNPAKGIKQVKDHKAKAVDTIHRALTVEEQIMFMQAMKDSFYFELIALLLHTGMRGGEASALTWADIDWQANVIHITKTITFTETGKITIGSAKTESGIRDIPMTDQIKSILKSQKAKMAMINGKVIQITEPIFKTVYGHNMTTWAINNAIEDALHRLEADGKHIDRFTAHALRDTFATRYIEQGGSAQTLKTILGHGSLAMTMDLYAHVMPNTKQEEMNRIQIVM